MIKAELDKASLAKLNKTMDRKAREIERKRKEGMQKALAPAVDKAKSLVPVRTGRLRDTIEAVQYEDGAALIADTPYAASVEYLDRPYLRPAAKNTGPIVAEARKYFKTIAEK